MVTISHSLKVIIRINDRDQLEAAVKFVFCKIRIIISIINFYHRFASSKSGKIYLHTDIRMIIFRKSDLDTAADHNITPGKLGGFELRSFTNGPTNPKFSPRKINFRHEE